MEEIKKRIQELAMRSFDKGIYVYSDFLRPSEIALVMSMGLNEVGIEFFGGADYAERKVCRFGNERCFGNASYPVKIIKIAPLQDKFADEITHRDCLGALMNLGVVREKIGDIFVSGKYAFVVAEEKIANHIVGNIKKIKRNTVKCTFVQEINEEFMPKLEEVKLSVSSPRIDGVIAKLFRLSRESVVELFREKKIFLDGIVIENNSKILDEEQVISVRGYGKFIYKGQCGISKKGKTYVLIEKFI